VSTVARANPLGLCSRAFAGLVVAMAAMCACSSAAAARATRAAPAQYLFSIPSGSGSLTGPDDQHLTLRLTDARRYLTRFTDRPLRQAAVVADVDFARRFRADFAAGRPNAVLTYTPRGAHIPVSIVLTIGAPRWNAGRLTWTFPATRIRKKPDNLPGTTVRIRPPLIPNPRRFTHDTLLIDGGAAPVTTGCTIQPAADCGAVENLIGLSGGGVADSLGGFLQQLFMTSITRTAGERFFIRLAVEYSYPLENPDGAAGATGLEPVSLIPYRGFDPAVDARIQPQGLMCNFGSTIAIWQSVHPPAAGGAFIFDLAIYGSGRAPIYAATLRYPAPPGAIASAGCA
jgi:hypothetical protein